MVSCPVLTILLLLFLSLLFVKRTPHRSIRRFSWQMMLISHHRFRRYFGVKPKHADDTSYFIGGASSMIDINPIVNQKFVR